MTDDEARAAAWARHARRFTAEGAEAYAHGWKDALVHARRWRPLTSDEATWPEQGAYVAMVRAGEPSLFRSGRILGDACERMLEHGWTHWMPLPLPPPSEEVGGG